MGLDRVDRLNVAHARRRRVDPAEIRRTPAFLGQRAARRWRSPMSTTRAARSAIAGRCQAAVSRIRRESQAVTPPPVDVVLSSYFECLA